jgi:hypothetical protein
MGRGAGITDLAHGTINGADELVVQLIQPADNPSVIIIRWPAAPTITTAARYNEVASAAMKILAYASTRYAQIQAQRRC